MLVTVLRVWHMRSLLCLNQKFKTKERRLCYFPISTVCCPLGNDILLVYASDTLAMRKYIHLGESQHIGTLCWPNSQTCDPYWSYARDQMDWTSKSTPRTCQYPVESDSMSHFPFQFSHSFSCKLFQVSILFSPFVSSFITLRTSIAANWYVHKYVTSQANRNIDFPTQTQKIVIPLSVQLPPEMIAYKRYVLKTKKEVNWNTCFDTFSWLAIPLP